MSDHSPADAAVAVIGIAGRFPGARNIEEFWRNLQDGVESITRFTDEELRRSGVAEEWLRDARYVRANGVLADIELFDAEFFEFTPREAEITDPQHRILLECAWESLEDAGYDPERFAGRIGVYAGAGISTYLLRNILGGRGLPPGVSELQILMGNNKDYVPTRISYKLNLKGPSVNVNTACSTSLVAVHLACQALLDFHCDMALAGGVGIQVPQRQGYWYEEGGIGSPDGHCRAFDARAAGTVGGNGAGLVVLKRLPDAFKDGDYIRAVIKGSAINNDGRAKVGFTAPSVQGQAEVIADALAVAGVEPQQIGYVEAHGTGTALGDPVELTALTQAFGADRAGKPFCAIGSVKTNVGHLDEAAGVAGLIKAVCALEHGVIPPSLHFERANPDFDLAASPFFVSTRAATWMQSPRRAGVSSFGIGGTNAHAVLEQAPARPPSHAARRWHVLPLSARAPDALDAATSNLTERLAEASRRATDAEEHAAWLADAAYTLSVGRRAFSHRRVLIADSRSAAETTRDPHAAGATFAGVASEDRKRPTVFLFPGQGTQYSRMAGALYRQERGFRQSIDRCAEILRDASGYDFRTWLYPTSSADQGRAAAELRRTVHAQPVLFSVEYALAQLLMAWGVRPEAMIGHSLGEYVAACLAGVFSLEDALTLVARRGALMETLSRGAMLAVRLSEVDVRALLPAELSVAASNGPSLTTVSGRADAIGAFRLRLLEDGVPCQALATSHGFHSPLMEPILPELLDLFERVPLRAPTIPYFSNVTGAIVTSAQATDPMYWVTHTRQTVRFGDALASVFGGELPILLEVGPGATLASVSAQHSGRPAALSAYSTLPGHDDPSSDDRTLFTALGRLWTDGVPIDWPAVYAGERRYRVPLPTYPFRRQRYWIDNGHHDRSSAAPQATGSSLLGASADKRADVASWFYVPSWRRSVAPAAATTRPTLDPDRWLLFVDRCGLGVQLAGRLADAGAEVTTVSAGADFINLAPAAFVLNPHHRDHYFSLVTALTATHGGRWRVVHLWSVEAAAGLTTWPDAQDRGFYSLLFFVQAVQAVAAGREVKIEVVSGGIHDVVGGEPLHPHAATLLGAVKVIAQECPTVTCRSIDLELQSALASGDARSLDQLHQELSSEAQEPVVAWRGPYRWTQHFEPLTINPVTPASSRFKRGGTYLITGGLGGVGTIIGDYLAREYQANLALVSRTGLPSLPLDPDERLVRVAPGIGRSHEQRLRNVDALRQRGAEVMVLTADVADVAQLTEAIARVRQRFGRIDGVIHAAGVTSGEIVFNLLEDTSRSQAEALFRPKIQGALALAQVLADQEPDFCLLISSNAAILGGLGFSAYAAANAFMDVFATAQHRRTGHRWISANWDGWPTEEFTGGSGRFQTSIDRFAMTRAECERAVESVLAQPLPHVVVSSGDLGPRLHLWTSHGARSRDESVTSPPSRGAAPDGLAATAQSLSDPHVPTPHSRPSLSTPFVPPGTPTEQRLCRIWQELFAIDRIGVDDNFFELRGDSLLAMQLIATASREFHVRVPMRRIFEHASVSKLAAVIDSLEAATSLLTTVPADGPSGDDEEGSI